MKKGNSIAPAVLVGVVTAIAAGVAGCLALVLGVLLARKAASWTIRRDEEVFSVDGDTITLKRTPESSHPGTFVIHFPGGAAEIGEILRLEDHHVTRKIVRVVGNLTAVKKVRWEGETHITLEEVGALKEVTVDGPIGACPAWQFGSDGADVWSIHVHGIRADRHNAVRSVAAATAAGHTSLVVSYRGDQDAPRASRGAASLGCTEWADIDAAVAYAIEHGAQRVYLFGWSMGASISLLATERSAHRERIAGLVLISPASDWRGIIAHGAARRGLPVTAGRLGHLMLSHRWLSRLAGLTDPVNFEALDWTIPGRLAVPTLVIHSTGDRTVPFDTTNRFVEAGAPYVTLHTAPDADHSWEFNVDPEGFVRAITSWLAAQDELDAVNR